jgi:hypothetical protein
MQREKEIKKTDVKKTIIIAFLMEFVKLKIQTACSILIPLDIQI